MALSSTVKAARAGLQNKLRSWLGGRSTAHASSPTASASGSVRYLCGTIEAQTRQLADCAYACRGRPCPVDGTVPALRMPSNLLDVSGVPNSHGSLLLLLLPWATPTGPLGTAHGARRRRPPSNRAPGTGRRVAGAFLLGDYTTALTAYRQASSEFKGDKAWSHYAVSQEMCALCLHGTEGAWKEMDAAVVAASETYLKLTKAAGDSAARHATRAVLLQLDLLPHAPPKKRYVHVHVACAAPARRGRRR